MVAKLFDVVVRGYSRRQVDELWARIEANEITGDEVRDAEFDVVLRGYDRHQVHAAVGDVLKRLDEKSEG
jgi:DivIVA domain-containing protein